MVVVLAAEDPSSEGPLASIPRERGMDCKDKSSTTAKKLVQARLPFKRLNPVPKENEEPKRTRGSPAPTSLRLEISGVENDMECSHLPLPCGKSLVNGRGPMDSFTSRIDCQPAETIDLTEDSNPADGALQLSTHPLPDSGPPAHEDEAREDPEAVHASAAECNMDAVVDPASPPQSGSAQEHQPQSSDTEEGGQVELPSHENESLLSPPSISSSSVAESSPEAPKSTSSPPSAGPKTNTNMEDKKVKRRSLKGSEEQRQKRQQEAAERKRLRQEAQEAREQRKEEARRMKEEREREKKEKRERDEKERREKKEKEEKEKAEKQRAKEEQRKVKQEAKLEEKRKKEEEKRLKEEKDRIKAEKAEITRFLQKPKTQQAPKTLAAAFGKFAPFEIKQHMCLAPVSRVECKEEVLEALDRYLEDPDGNLDALRDLRRRRPRRSGPTHPWREKPGSEGVMLVEDPKPDGIPDRECFGRMKLLQFRENYRPAYWGTWSKKSSVVSPRCPLRQDKALLDYEIDSDEEWEEEEPGESLSHSEGDEEEEGGEDDDEDDGFFVPHGYLSDGEGALEEEEGGDPEKQKLRQKLKAREWDELMSKKKCNVLEKVVKGCVWVSEGPEAELLLPFAVCPLEPLPVEDPSTPEGPSQERLGNQLLSQLLPLLHGNVNSSKVIISEFQEFCRKNVPAPTTSPPGSSDNVPTRIRLKRLIKEIAVYEKRSNYRRCCWYVHSEVLGRFDMETLPVPSQWSYITPGPHNSRDDASGGSGTQTSPAAPPSSSNTPSSSKRKSTGSMSITKFMKKCANPEQGEAMEADGFQADTEDDEDEADCIIISTEPLKDESTSPGALQNENQELMDVAPSEAAVVSLSCHTPTPATA